MACPRAPPTSRWAAAAAPVADREDLAGGEQAKAEQRNRHPDRHAHQDVSGRLHPQVHAGEGDQRHQPGRHPLADLAPAALRHQAVQDPDQDDHQRAHLFGGQRPGGPIGAELHPERPRPLHQRGQQELDHRAPAESRPAAPPAAAASADGSTGPAAAPTAAPFIAVQEPSAASPRIAGTKPGTSNPASHPTTASSTTVTATARPRSPSAKTTSDSATSTTAATSQPTPVVCR